MKRSPFDATISAIDVTISALGHWCSNTGGLVLGSVILVLGVAISAIGTERRYWRLCCWYNSTDGVQSPFWTEFSMGSLLRQ